MNESMKLRSFGNAIDAVKQGHKIKRVNWNGKDQYITLGSHISYKEPDGTIVNPDHITMGNTALVFHGTQGVQVGWLASQADMLSDDWIVFD